MVPTPRLTALTAEPLGALVSGLANASRQLGSLGKAEALCEQMTLGVSSGLLALDVTGPDALLQPRVVRGELLQNASPPTVDTGITDVAEGVSRATAVQRQRRGGRSHA